MEYKFVIGDEIEKIFASTQSKSAAALEWDRNRDKADVFSKERVETLRATLATYWKNRDDRLIIIRDNLPQAAAFWVNQGNTILLSGLASAPWHFRHSSSSRRGYGYGSAALNKVIQIAVAEGQNLTLTCWSSSFGFFDRFKQFQKTMVTPTMATYVMRRNNG